jgi:hypothetical protein
MAGLDIIEDGTIKKIPNIVTSKYKGIFYLESGKVDLIDGTQILHIVRRLLRRCTVLNSLHGLGF